ncbi:hypothetical protein PybrP1_004145 [[Pythium] brassicae (nom. inval.)]|nr:hypothetical protein PybrP1_004145 [[Pythium] brassicae (nom. inval.)]
MLTELPDEVKQRVWRHLAAQELCRVECVARDISRGANADAVWKARTRSLLAAEHSRLAHLRPPHSAFWRLWYRDCFDSVRTFEAANAAFDAAKRELQELRRERAELKELLQSAKSKSQSAKHARSVQMGCVRWMNRSHRRQSASESRLSAQSVALSKAELSTELQQVEAAIQAQSNAIFSLRSQYQKSLHRMTTQLARGTAMLRDLGDTCVV